MFDRGPVCPLIRKPCIKHGCEFWVQMRGSHPQTGVDVDEFMCLFRAQLLSTLDNSRQQMNVTSAATEIRNALVSGISRLMMIRDDR